jgi:phosphatidylglycerol---prolipoprotein diacylglyceryl transferase
MIIYPHIERVALKLGPINIYWYGIMYLLGFILAWILARIRIQKHFVKNWSLTELDDLIFYSALGVIIGGRLGQIFFYDFPEFIQNPLLVFKIWQGGMSFHGGLIGVLVSSYFFAKKHRKSFFAVTDFIAPLAPLGLGLGRIGNFINGELWGRVTSVPWAMVFPNAGPLPRHPSQLYEFFLEGIILFLILWFYATRERPKMAISALFLLAYGGMRFFIEFFREPDPQLGFIAWNWLTMGQLLSLPMIIIGIILLDLLRKAKNCQ